MSDGVHLLVPFAGCQAAGCQAALAGLQLPHLAQALARMARSHADAGEPHQLSMPHERVLARACGLDAADGLAPWAAWGLLQAGRDPGTDAWAWITPSHWRVGRDHVAMAHPDELALTSEESATFLAAVLPYFEEDGIALEAAGPGRWIARGEVFRNFPTASLDRVSGAVIDPWMPRGGVARPLRRLQQEMQMLLYTHPANDARTARGALPVNSFWVSGAGALPTGHAAHAPADLRVAEGLRKPALHGDWAAWADAWRAIDAECIAALGDAPGTQLTLCGERHAHTWTAAAGGALQRIRRLWSRPAVAPVLEAL
jgi:hypothetical protein